MAVPAQDDDTRAPARDSLWIVVFALAFLGLMVDGADLMFLS